MFTLNIAPVRIETIKLGSANVELPVYEDLLGAEYDVIEALDQREARWNQKLILLADKLANEKGLKAWEVANLLNNLETASVEEKLNAIGTHLADLIELQATRPSEAARILETAVTVMKNRVDESFSIEHAKRMPKKFLQQLADFAYREQMQGKYLSYGELLAKQRMAEDQLTAATGVVETVIEVVKESKIKGTTLDKLRQALVQYGVAQETSGKDPMIPLPDE